METEPLDFARVGVDRWRGFVLRRQVARSLRRGAAREQEGCAQDGDSRSPHRRIDTTNSCYVRVHGARPLSAATTYLRRNPDEIVRATFNAGRLRFGVPIAALRWLAGQAKGKKAPKDIELGAVPPALRLSATVDAMGTSLRAGANVRSTRSRFPPTRFASAFASHDVKLKVLDDSETPVATLVNSGALDLSKPGNLVKFIPKRPKAIVDAHDDRIVIDLLKIPSLAKNKRLRRALQVVTPLVGIRAIETEGDHLYIALRATPAGFREALVALREEL